MSSAPLFKTEHFACVSVDVACANLDRVFWRPARTINTLVSGGATEQVCNRRRARCSRSHSAVRAHCDIDLSV